MNTEAENLAAELADCPHDHDSQADGVKAPDLEAGSTESIQNICEELERQDVLAARHPLYRAQRCTEDHPHVHVEELAIPEPETYSERLQRETHSPLVTLEVTPARMINIVKTACAKELRPSQAIKFLQVFGAELEQDLTAAMREFARRHFTAFVETSDES